MSRGAACAEGNDAGIAVIGGIGCNCVLGASAELMLGESNADGGGWYASPGGRPDDAPRKNTSHDLWTLDGSLVQALNISST